MDDSSVVQKPHDNQLVHVPNHILLGKRRYHCVDRQIIYRESEKSKWIRRKRRVVDSDRNGLIVWISFQHNGQQKQSPSQTPYDSLADERPRYQHAKTQNEK